MQSSLRCRSFGGGSTLTLRASKIGVSTFYNELHVDPSNSRKRLIAVGSGIFLAKSDVLRLPLRFYDILQVDPENASREAIHRAYEL